MRFDRVIVKIEGCDFWPHSVYPRCGTMEASVAETRGPRVDHERRNVGVAALFYSPVDFTDASH